jgi:hypothetical protein
MIWLRKRYLEFVTSCSSSPFPTICTHAFLPTDHLPTAQGVPLVETGSPLNDFFGRYFVYRLLRGQVPSQPPGWIPASSNSRIYRYVTVLLWMSRDHPGYSDVYGMDHISRKPVQYGKSAWGDFRGQLDYHTCDMNIFALLTR